MSPRPGNPWNALWAMMIGFFMILVDSTIVAVANPSIMERLQTDYNAVIWVTSAYLLAYAVPLLVAGRLGDQFGPKNLYLVGLFVFTAASLWCGLSGSIEALIAARVVQGIGAALLTPQTLSTITRIFPAERRGLAMSVWGATAGVATLVGPLAGGVLVDRLGWQWIFFVNVPIGIIGIALAAWLVPVLPTNKHRFDVLGVVLSGAAMFLVVFGLQEGESHQWSGWIWAMIAGGVALMVAFVYWQAVNKREPLIPLRIFADRDFTLSNVGVAVIGFAVTAMVVPVMFYAQVVCGLTPTRSALLTAPMAIASGLLAPVVGRIVDRAHPTAIIGFGFSVLAVALTWLSVEMTPTTPMWRLVLPFTAMGIGMAFVWAPLATTATRNLPPHLAGAGSGVYNATRQVGSVLGSAGVAALMTARIGAEMPGGQARPPAEGAMLQVPEFLREPFASALSQTMMLPAFIALFGVIAALFMVGAAKSTRTGVGRRAPDDARTEVLPVISDDPDLYWRAQRPPTADRVEHGGYVGEDDDDYVEFTVTREPEYVPTADAVTVAVADTDSDTEPLPTRVGHPRAAPAEAWHSSPVQSWHSLLTEQPLRDEAARPPTPEPIGFAHNGFHVDEDKLEPLPSTPLEAESQDYYAETFQQLADNIDSLSDNFAEFIEEGRGAYSFDAQEYGRHGQPDEVKRPRHYREDPDDSANYGRHSQPRWD